MTRRASKCALARVVNSYARKIKSTFYIPTNDQDFDEYSGCGHRSNSKGEDTLTLIF